jgi:two-component system chemotaxis sensor kinase CheA
MDTIAAIRETFFQECEEQLAELEVGLEEMESGVSDAETVNAVFRAVHSIKGGAGAFKLDRLVRFAHTFETTLDLIRGGRLAPSVPLLKTMLRAADVLADLVKASRNDDPVDEARMETLIGELKSAAGARAPAAPPPSFDPPTGDDEPFDFTPTMISIENEPAPAAPPTPVYVIQLTPRPELYRKGNETTRLLRELARLGEVSVVCDSRSLPPLDELDPEGAYLSWRAELTTGESLATIEEVFEFVIDDCDLDIVARADAPQASRAAPPAPPAAPPPRVSPPPLRLVSGGEDGKEAERPAPSAAAPEADKGRAEAPKTEAAATIRVDLERVDRLINLVGELVINQAMLSQRVTEAGLARASSVAAGLAALEQLTREIQEGVMAIRAQPVKTLFQRMSRIVRELTDATGKSARLKTEGEATEVDRTVIERIADPLTHMIRNAVDHGVETPEVREAAGKPAQGEVRLSAAHRSGRIIIEVSDDGAGIDRARVREIAIKKELIAPDAQLSDSEIDNLLFLPGFSTAKSVSDISGRGVGMDVVKRSIQALGGRIAISSRPGQGSTFSMSLPLTLAVLDGMVVKVADQTLVVPLTAIVETLRPKRSDVHALGVNARVISDRGGFAPLIDVGQELGYRATPADPLESVVLVVETEESTRCALVVDAIHDQRQVVIKSLEANYRKVPGIAAATILGDGRVALILDIDTFVARTNRSAASSEPLFAAAG